MNIKLMHCPEKFVIANYFWDKPDITDDQIEVKTVMTGICRSDIASYAGWENTLPLGIFGHEGLGVVNKVGKNITDVVVGDYVATWSDPAYGEYYNANHNQYAKIPELHQKYILQPVASAINIYLQTTKYIDYLKYYDEDILLVGTGFMSMIIGQFNNRIQVVGKSNLDIWKELGITVYPNFESLPKNKYKVIIDLSSNANNFEIFSKNLGDVEALISYASTPFTPVSTNFFESCWNCHTLIMPSPRNSDFNNSMKIASELISNNELKTEMLWSKEYKAFDLESMKQAFEDGMHRNSSYIRGYFRFDNE